MGIFRNCANKTIYIFRGNAQAIHSCVDFQMKTKWTFLTTGLRRRAFKQTELIAIGNRRRESKFDKYFFFSRPVASQNQDWPPNSSVAEFYSFADTSYSKPIRPCFL